MADDNTSLEPSAFNIMNTMEAGMGDAKLVNDLLSPETSTATPAEITPIIKEVTSTEKGELEKKPTTEKSGADLISGFLEAEDDEAEEGIKTAVTKEKPLATAEEEISITNENDSQFSALANDLYSLGVFNKDEDGKEDEPITTPEQFLEKFNKEKQKGASEMVQNFLAQFGEDYQEAFQAIYVKGVDPKEYFGTYDKIVNFSELDLTQEENQIKVIKQGLLDQGFEAEEVDAELERVQNYGDLEAVSQRHHKVLIKKEAKKLQELQATAEAEQQNKAAIRTQYINNVQTVLGDKVKEKSFDGIPLSPKLADELKEYLLVDKWKTNSGETLSDFDKAILDLKKPENHQLKVKYALLLKTLEKDPTLSTIQKTGVTTKTDELFKSVVRQAPKTSTQTPAPSTSPLWNSLK